MPKDKKPIRRRTLLKTAGLGATAAIIPGTVAAKPVDVHGIVYDTLTHKQAPAVRGEIKRKGNNLKGAISIAGHHVPLTRLSKLDDPGPDKFYATLTDNQYARDDSPLTVQVTDHGGYFSGLLKRPSTKFGDLGFRLHEKNSYDLERAKDTHSPVGNWHESEHTFNVPSKDLPTDSGSDRLIKLAKVRDSVNNGGGN